MSGSSSSSSSSWRSGGGDTPGGDSDCNFVDRTILASPVAPVIATLTVNDILTVELETSPRRRVVTKGANGQIAGAVTSVNLVRIIECIERGVTYEAQVLSISAGKVEIEVRPKP